MTYQLLAETAASISELKSNPMKVVASAHGMPVAVFSMEMPGEALAMRMMSSLGRIDQHKVRTGKLDDDDWPRLTSAINLLAETKMFIDDTPALTPTEVRSRARRLTREHGQLGLIVLDYLQLMQSPSSGDNRVQQISDISRGLKALETSSTETYVSGTMAIDADNNEIINMPFITCFLFTCIKGKSEPYQLIWSSSLN